jgi:uncharacterized membrane protein
LTQEEPPQGQPPSPPPPPAPPPAPPPPPPPGEVSRVEGSSAPFGIGECVSYGWKAYWKNLGPLLLITLVIIVIDVVISGIGQATGNRAIAVIFSLIGWIVGLLLAFGLIRATIAVTKGEKPEVAMLFQTDGFGPYIIASILFGIATFIGLILCIIPGLIFAVVYHFYGYAIVENPSLGPTDALKRAADISRGHRWELFGLFIVLILINIVGLIACLVGVIFTSGISAVAIAYAYRSLSGQSVVQPT